MSRRAEFTLVTLGLAVPAFALFPVLFPPHELAKPTPAELPLFVTLAALESLLFGLGVAFLVSARRYVKQTPEYLRNRAWAVYVTIGWLLLSWYPHDGLHIHAGLNLGALLAIEYAFHVPLYLAPLVLIWALTGFARAWKHPLQARTPWPVSSDPHPEMWGRTRRMGPASAARLLEVLVDQPHRDRALTHCRRHPLG